MTESNDKYGSSFVDLLLQMLEARRTEIAAMRLALWDDQE